MDVLVDRRRIDVDMDLRGVPRVTMVMRDRCERCSVSDTVRLSIL